MNNKNDESVEKWYFTFGINGPNEHYVQPILATDVGDARDTMFDEHGSDWAFQYSENEWLEHLEDKYIGFDRLQEKSMLISENIKRNG